MALQGNARYRIGLLSLSRYKHGIERQVSEATRLAVAEGARRGVKPWLERGEQAAPVGAVTDSAEAGSRVAVAVSGSSSIGNRAQDAGSSDSSGNRSSGSSSEHDGRQ